MAVGDDAPSDDQAQAARAAAEARRRRIMDNRGQRMGVVSGGKPEENAAESAAANNRGTLAMRRRRMAQQKKKEVAATTQEESTEGTKEEDKKEEPAVEEPAVTETTTEVRPAPATTSTTATTSTDNTSTGEQRKYQGVARMRRKMIQEKKAAEAAQEPDVTKPQDVLPAAPSQNVPLAYVVMQLSSILILFASGLQVGLFQHSPLEVNMVHWKLSPSENGLGILQASSGPTDIKELFETSNMDPLSATVEQADVGDEFDEFESQEEDDEVEEDNVETQSEDTAETAPASPEQAPSPPPKTVKEAAPKVAVKDENLDPLFRVDLDELTKGDGLFFMATRFAVRVHRLNLFIFYEMPIKIAKTLWQLPSLLLQTPPVFCLLALVVRQATQRFGGDLTVPEKKQSKDILAMAKGMVIQFLTGMFPTAVTLYKVWTNLRADMYILLCGFFVGVAWMHTMQKDVLDEDSTVFAGSSEGEL